MVGRYGSRFTAEVEEIDRHAHHPQQIKTQQPATIIEEGEEPDYNDDGFAERVFTEGLFELFIPLPNKARTHIGNCEINLATLQRMNIHAIQRDLVRLTGKIVRSGRMEVHPMDGETDSPAVQVRELMKEYCKYQLSFNAISCK